MKSMKQLSEILEERSGVKRPKNLSTEFQHFGVFLADELGDPKYSLYIKLAKTYPRALLEEALNFTKGYTTAKHKGRVFMWKLKQLQKESSE